MGNRLFLFIVSFLLILSSYLIFNNQSAFAEDTNRLNNNITLTKDQTVNKDYFASGNNVILSGTVNGDAYLSGGNIIVDGTINGDLLAAGGTITIKGNVVNNIRVAAGQVTILGNVGRNVTIAAGQIILTREAKITGSLTYWSSSKAYIQPGAVITGRTTQNVPPQKIPTRNIIGDITRALITLKILNLLSYFILGLILLKLLPIHTRRKINILQTKPWISLGTGFLTVILFPFIFLILLITIIGIPIALILLAAFLILAYISVIFVSFWFGQIILNSLGTKNKGVWALLVGLIIYEMLTIIPLIGWIVSLFTLFFGVGGLVLAEKSLFQDLRSKKII